MERIVQQGDDLYFPVRVIPRAHVNQVIDWEMGRLKVRLRAVAEKGRANMALIELLAAHFSVPQSQIEIVRGKTNRNKVIKIRSCSIKDILKS